MLEFTRGQTVRATVQFFDKDGFIAQPDSANITWSYANGYSLVTSTQAMAFDIPSQSWIYNIDTSGFVPGKVSLSYKTHGTAPLFAKDDEFMLIGNAANVGEAT